MNKNLFDPFVSLYDGSVTGFIESEDKLLTKVKLNAEFEFDEKNMTLSNGVDVYKLEFKHKDEEENLEWLKISIMARKRNLSKTDINGFLAQDKEKLEKEIIKKREEIFAIESKIMNIDNKLICDHSSLDKIGEISGLKHTCKSCGYERIFSWFF